MNHRDQLKKNRGTGIPACQQAEGMIVTRASASPTDRQECLSPFVHYTIKRIATITAALLCAFAMHSSVADKNAPIEIALDSTFDQVTIGGKLFTELINASDDRYENIPRPFFYPVIGPTGAAMTRNYPMKPGVEGEANDHPHHRSLWFAHGSVNGIDYWTQGKGKGTIVGNFRSTTDRPLLSSDKFGHVPTSTNQYLWIDTKGKAVLTQEQSYFVLVHKDDSRVIDITQKLSPVKGVEQVKFGDTKEGTMAMRLHPALRLKGDVATGKAINSEGVTGKDIWGKRAKWVAYWGVIDGKTCGVAIFDHPTNLRHPTWWHARDYGLVAANPFGIHDFEKKPKGTGDYTLKQGETLSLRYRFVFFAGTA